MLLNKEQLLLRGTYDFKKNIFCKITGYFHPMIAFLQTNLLNQRFSQLAVRDMFKSSCSLFLYQRK